MRALVAGLIGLIGLFISIASWSAAIKVVNGGCTLRDAIRAANADATRGDCSAGSGNDVIRIPGGTTITLNSTLPTIDTTIAIEAASGVATIDGDGNGPLFVIDDAFVLFSDVNISNGRRCLIGGNGGAGVRIFNGSNVTFNNVTLSGHTNCMEPGGGALRVEDSTITVADSRFVDNAVFRFVAGPLGSIGNASGANIYLLNATASILRTSIVDTSGFYRGSSGIHSENSTLNIEDSLFQADSEDPYLYRANAHIRAVSGGSVMVENSTFSSQLSNREFFVRAESGAGLELRHVTFAQTALGATEPVEMSNTILDGDCSLDSGFTINQGNWFTDASCTGSATPGNLFLLLLDDRGGPTETHALHWLSDAINAGDQGQCQPDDQRGVTRDAMCDIGAYERIDQTDIGVDVVMLSPAPYYVTQPLIYRIDVSNLGPGVANAIQIDLGLDNIVLNDIDGLCNSNPCVINSMISGYTGSITVGASPVDFGLGDFGLTATASNGPGSVFVDTNQGNNSDTETDFLSAAADLAITKTPLTSPPYTMGQTISYELEVENLGPGIANSLVVSEFPDGLTITSISNCTNQPAGPCNFNGLDPSESVTMTVSATIDAGTFDNLASVTAASFEPDLENNIDDRGNGGNTATDADLVLAIARTTMGPYFTGQVVTYYVSLFNHGPDPATNTTVEVGVEGGTVVGVGAPCTFLPCEVGVVNNNVGAFFQVDVQVDLPGTVTVSAYVSADQTDANLSDNFDSNFMTAEQSADISLGLSPQTPPPYAEGNQINYALNVQNLGFDDADNVQITVSLENLQIISAISDNCLTLPSTIPVLGIVQTEQMEIVAVPVAIGHFDISATATADQLDFLPSNNTDNTGNGGYADISSEELLFRDSLESF